MSEHPTVTAVDALAAELLDEAEKHRARRTARTLVAGNSLRSTLIALLTGTELAEHDSPPGGTLHVLGGSVLLRTPSRQWELAEGDLATLPPERHSVYALTDATLLLTVALR
ncbi:hypothetical protein ACWGRK_13880 [Saccharomonospora azurea]|uniref:Cupin domain-containing protein n=1 Tax=Saccharomonospora azurea NA-128 TaxID=882081 RepID=H8GEH5_9PSEU|nr:hypothetical protein [Saccharomonospora azurea]EHK83954.1 hypothetical protein SZMC14600_18669 [Saccharomonospora azurea SZMC 14600]EHY87970.1 hypothetical protein SacazDRAFT_01024 [Saccharomonospora azurea NA-128]